MKKKILLTGDRYEIFEDVNERNVIYGMPSSYFDEHRERIMGGIVGDSSHDPDQLVEVYHIKKVKELDGYNDGYDVVGSSFEIPLSKMESVFVKIEPNNKWS